MDAISLLKDDHRAVERLFKRFEKTGDRAVTERRRIVDEIIKELSVHAEIEETVFYPAVRQAVPQAEDEVLEALEEHHVAKWVLSELEGMPADAERFEAKVTVMMENIRHHVEEEESDLFPQVRKAMSRTALNDMGDAMARAKLVAPTRPHPRSPDTPPGNIVSGVVASALDKAREAGQELVGGAAGVVRRAGANAATPSPAKRTRRTTSARKSSAKKAAAKRTSAKRTAKRAPAKRATGSARKASGSAKRVTKKATGTTKKAARSASRTTKTTARKASTATKRTTKKAAGTAKRTAKRATGTTRKTAGTAKRTAKKTARKTAGTAKRTAKKTTGSRPRKAAKKRS